MIFNSETLYTPAPILSETKARNISINSNDGLIGFLYSNTVREFLIPKMSSSLVPEQSASTHD